MRKKSVGLVSLVLAAGLGTTLGVPAVSAAPAHTPTRSPGVAADRSAPGDELPNPAEEKKRALREEAITGLLNGTSKARVEKRGASTVVKVGRAASARSVNRKGVRAGAPKSEDQYVELSREKTDKIFVILAEFGDKRDPRYPDQDTDPDTPGPTTFNGPLNNAIPAPDRSTDNSTVWQPNYDRQHFADLYFGQGGAAGSGGDTESVKQYFERQSSGRYSVDGYVTDWVKVPYNEARYGRSDGYPCAGNVCSNTWDLVVDGVTQWVADQKAAGRTDADIKTELSAYDKWDRNDYDHDGNFNEPDGYIDHFQIVHAGGDQADGDPIQGEDAIWSHRWNAYQGTGQGPAYNPDGGTQIGSTGIWVGGLHDPAGERRGERLHPRVRPRPGAARPLRHLGRARGQGEQRRVVVADVAEPGGRRHRRGHRHACLRPRRLGQAAARLARLRDRAARAEPAHRPRPARVQLRPGAGRRRGAAQEAGGDPAGRAVRRREELVQRHR